MVKNFESLVVDCGYRCARRGKKMVLIQVMGEREESCFRQREGAKREGIRQVRGRLVTLCSTRVDPRLDLTS